MNQVKRQCELALDHGSIGRPGDNVLKRGFGQRNNFFTAGLGRN